MYKRNADEVLKMNNITINERCGILIVKYLEIPHYAYTHRYRQYLDGLAVFQ